MKLRLRIASALVALAMLAGGAMAWAATAPGPASGLTGTLHDFSTSVAGVANAQSVGLCTFCHTTHRAASTSLLWNHSLSTNTFKWDVTSTTAGTTYPTFVGNTYTGPTAKCLSCHDGSVAVGDIAWFNGASAPGGTATNPTKIPAGAFLTADPSNVAGSMSGNHPVAMPYPYQQAKNTYNGVTTGANYISTEWATDPTTGTFIRLFNDDGSLSHNITAGAVATKTGIECSSCHDPHNKQTVDTYFLRAKLTGSDSTYICLACHTK